MDTKVFEVEIGIIEDDRDMHSRIITLVDKTATGAISKAKPKLKKDEYVLGVDHIATLDM